MTPLERFQHLLAMAAADERMHEDELGYLAERASELGISRDEFHNALEQAISGHVPLALPSGPAERRALLKDLIRMMAADGVLQGRERQLFAHVASALEVDTEELHQIIDATISENS